MYNQEHSPLVGRVVRDYRFEFLRRLPSCEDLLVTTLTQERRETGEGPTGNRPGVLVGLLVNNVT